MNNLIEMVKEMGYMARIGVGLFVFFIAIWFLLGLAGFLSYIGVLM